MAQGMVDEYNKKVLQQGIGENEMKAICLELKEGDQLNGRKFDLIVVSNDIFQTFSPTFESYNLISLFLVRFGLSSYR